MHSDGGRTRDNRRMTTALGNRRVIAVLHVLLEMATVSNSMVYARKGLKGPSLLRGLEGSRGRKVQGYLAHKKLHPPGTLR